MKMAGAFGQQPLDVRVKGSTSDDGTRLEFKNLAL